MPNQIAQHRINIASSIAYNFIMGTALCKVSFFLRKIINRLRIQEFVTNNKIFQPYEGFPHVPDMFRGWPMKPFFFFFFFFFQGGDGSRGWGMNQQNSPW